MTYRAVLRGYLLEEALAWLLRNAQEAEIGYRAVQMVRHRPVRHGGRLAQGGRLARASLKCSRPHGTSAADLCYLREHMGRGLGARP
jgi:hypothetical protein